MKLSTLAECRRQIDGRSTDRRDSWSRGVMAEREGEEPENPPLNAFKDLGGSETWKLTKMYQKSVPELVDCSPIE